MIEIQKDNTKDKLMYFAKLTSIGLFSFLKINLLGIVSTMLVVAIEMYFLFKGVDAGHSAHVSAIPFLAILFSTRPIGCIITVATCLLSPIAFFSFGNKYIFAKLSNRILVDKSDAYVKPFLDKIFTKLNLDKPNLIQKGADFSIVKLGLIQQIKNESENKWLKKLITFGFEKAKLGDINFQEDGINLNEIIKIKVIDAIQNMTEPSREGIFKLLGLQWLLMVLVCLFPF